jgi:hypothetical protein
LSSLLLCNYLLIKPMYFKPILRQFYVLFFDFLWSLPRSVKKVQVSISSTLYAQIFCTNVFSAAFLRTYVRTYVEKSCQKDDVRTKNSNVKCWWNWHQFEVFPQHFHPKFVHSKLFLRFGLFWINLCRTALFTLQSNLQTF